MFCPALNLCLFLSGIITRCPVIAFTFHLFFSDLKSESAKNILKVQSKERQTVAGWRLLI